MQEWNFHAASGVGARKRTAARRCNKVEGTPDRFLVDPAPTAADRFPLAHPGFVIFIKSTCAETMLYGADNRQKKRKSDSADRIRHRIAVSHPVHSIRLRKGHCATSIPHWREMSQVAARNFSSFVELTARPDSTGQ